MSTTKNRRKNTAATEADLGQPITGDFQPGLFEKKNEVDITPFITNPEGNIYAVTNLPEEFVAVLFAWVSRSPKSFKEHLEIAIREGHIKAEDYVGKNAFETLTEKAKAFHDKWTVGYGHSSVAEHAVAHVGIEKVSRLASAELELSNEFYSITEYSQRYQKPQRGEWVNPFLPTPTRAVDTNNPHRKFERFMHKCFDTFEALINGVYQDLLKNNDAYLDTLSPAEYKKHCDALMKLAFEDARYALPLAMYTQLGMTANGRSWRDGLVKLYSSRYPEVVHMANEIKEEITKVLPTLLKYANKSEYELNRAKRIKSHFKPMSIGYDNVPYATLVHYVHENEAVTNIIAQQFVEQTGTSFLEGEARAKNMTHAERYAMIDDLIFEIGKFDNPPEAFKHVDYQADILVSEANWHQLLRHNRKTNFTFSQPSPYNGITIPPRIVQAGMQSLLDELAEESKKLYEELGDVHGAYVILNAHNRRVVAHFDLWEAYHLINLRTSPEAQWDIRRTFEDLYNQLKAVHPRLIQGAKRR